MKRASAPSKAVPPVPVNERAFTPVSTQKDPYALPDPGEEVVLLPHHDIMAAGVAKFQELANLNWPKSTGAFGLVQFDMRNTKQLGVMLGLVYMAMRNAENR